MGADCPIPSCDGTLYYDTCEECGHRETPNTATRQHDEWYKTEIRKLQQK